MISFEFFMKLYESDTFEKARKLAINSWLNIYNRKHSDDKKTINDVPDGIGNAKNKTELMNAISSWKNSENNLYKVAFNNVSNILKGSTDTDTDNQDNQNDTNDNQDTDSTDNTQDNQDNQNDTDDTQDTDSTEYEEHLKDVIDDPSKGSNDDLNSADFFELTDRKKAEKIALNNAEQKELERRQKELDTSYEKTRAQNFEKIMQSIGDLLDSLFPDVKIGDSLASIGTKSTENKEKEVEFESKVQQINDNCEDAEDEKKKYTERKIENVKNDYKYKLDNLKITDDEFAKTIQSKCSHEYNSFIQKEKLLNSKYKECTDLWNKINAYEERVYNLTDEEKETYEKLKKDYESLVDERNSLNDEVSELQNAYNKAYAKAKKDIKDDIEKLKEKKRNDLLQQRDNEINLISSELKKYQSDLKVSRDNLISYMKEIQNKYDKSNMPKDVIENITKLNKKLKDALGGEGKTEDDDLEW